MQAGKTQQFAASVSGTTNTAVSWLVNGVQGGSTSLGTITSAGLYTAPSVTSNTSVTVTARSAADTTKSASAAVTVTPVAVPVSVAVSPTSAALQAKGTQQFSASVSGTSNTAVTWSVDGVAGGNSTVGTVTSAGLYTAPSVSSSATENVTATSAADTSKTATASVSVSPAPTPVTVQISPTTASLQTGQTQQFTATVSGTTNTGINWLVNGVAGGNSTVGTISTSGLYTAPIGLTSNASVTVTAQSAYASTSTAQATVTIAGSSTASNGVDYYVATTGSDSNGDGSQARPWATIQKASTMVGPGATVHVAAGTYNGAITTNKSGTSSSPITYLSDSKWGALLRTTTSSNTVWQNNGNYVNIDGFDVAGARLLGIQSSADHTNIRNNRIHDLPDATCDPNGGAGVSFDDYINHVNGPDTATGNVVYNVGSNGCRSIHGIYGSIGNVTVENNIVYNVTGYGIHCWHASTHDIITNNLVFNSGGESNGGSAGIMVGADQGTNTGSYVANNIVIYNLGYGIGTEGSVSSVTFTHNDSWSNTSGNFYGQGSSSGNLSVNPQLVNYQANGSGDYHLSSSSPMIDAGTSTNAPADDMDGGPRPIGNSDDIGPYEYGTRAATWPW